MNTSQDDIPSTQQKKRRKWSWTRTLICAALALTYFLIFPTGLATVTWHEEVQLEDGRKPIIEEVRYCERSIGYKVSGLCRSAEIRFEHPNELGIINNWRGPVLPLVFNTWHGEFFIVGQFPTWREYIADGMPDHGYIGYKYFNGVWHRIDFSEIPPEIYVGNLLIENLPPNGTNFISVRDKAEDAYVHSTAVSHVVDPTFRDIN